MEYEDIKEWVETVDAAIDDDEHGEQIVDDCFVELSENSNIAEVSAQIAFFCAENGYINVLDLVLHNHQDIAGQKIYGENLMDFAIRCAGTEAIEYLRDYGMRPSKPVSLCTDSADSSEGSISEEQPQKRGKWVANVSAKGMQESVNVR